MATTETKSTCPYCGVGCGVIIESSGTQINGVRGDPDHPANFGRLCTKGATLHYLSGSSTHSDRFSGVNALTTSAFCPDSKQPEFKHASVKILKANLPWNLLAVAWLSEAQGLAAQAELRALLPEFAFASCVPFSDGAPVTGMTGVTGRTGLLFRAAHHNPAAGSLLARVEAALQLQGADILRYSNKKRGQRRAIRLHEGDTQTSLDGFLLAGDTSAQAWITTLLKDALPAHVYGRALLVPGATPPLPVVSKGQQVCACFNVTDRAIAAHLKTCVTEPGNWLASLQSTLKCGAHCGSCVPQLQRMVRQHAVSALTT